MVKLKNNTLDRNQASILGVKINSTQQSLLLNEILSFVKNKQQFFIVTPNPEIVLMAQKDSELKAALNSAEISLPDGTGIVFAAKIWGVDIKRRILGRRFMMELFELSHRNHLKVYLLGGDDAVIEASLEKLKNDFPKLIAKGSEGPKLGHDGKPVSEEELKKEKAIISKINSFSPDILFIGFGAPKQEKWFFKNRASLKVGGAMVIGGSLDVFSGYKNLPPQILSSIGLEWFWRLINEPDRFKRVINATVIFPLFVFRQKIRDLFIQ